MSAGRASRTALVLLAAAALLAACGGSRSGNDRILRTSLAVACLVAVAPVNPSSQRQPGRVTEDLTHDELLDQGRSGWEIKGVLPFDGPVATKDGGTCPRAAYVLMQREVSP